MKTTSILTALLLLVLVTSGQSQTEIISLRSKIFKETRSVKVSLPSAYLDYPDRKYEVAYLFDAQSDNFFNFMKATIDYLTADGYISPMILIGISAGNRQYEFTPAPETEQGKKYFQKSGGADSLVLFMSTEILPLIQKKYRCNLYNIGIGHSLGGTFLTHCLLRAPELFNASIIISPNYDYDNERLLDKFEVMTGIHALNKKFLYIAYGKEDTYEERFKPGTQRMDSLLIKKNIPGLMWSVTSLDNDSHGTTATEGVFKGLIALYRQFTLPYQKFTVMMNDTTRLFIDQLKQFYQFQSARAGIQLPSIGEINAVGYNCFYSNKTSEAIAVFEWALSIYPGDVNLYDSMGEMQQSAGNNKEALRYYLKGLAIVEQQKLKLNIAAYQRLNKGFKDRIHSVNISK